MEPVVEEQDVQSSHDLLKVLNNREAQYPPNLKKYGQEVSYSSSNFPNLLFSELTASGDQKKNMNSPYIEEKTDFQDESGKGGFVPEF